MKRLVNFAVLLMSCCFSMSVKGADLTDSEGYPIVYLRGEFTNPKWGVDAAYKFKRQGNIYTIHLSELTGQFKIADAEWKNFNYGADLDTPVITNSVSLSLTKGSINFKSENLQNVDISFAVSKAGDVYEANVLTIKVGGVAPQPQGISGTLPVMYINVYIDEEYSRLDDKIIDKDLSHKDYFANAEYWLDINGCEWMAEEYGAESIGTPELPLKLQIKARGNYTRTGFSKKPYKIKLDKKQNLLGLTKAKNKHYTLLAHADDNKGYLRNFTGFNLGERIELPWTPSQQPVELVINGDYRGLYFLTESIRVGEDRLEIEELADNENDASMISGGYVVELDNYDEENQIRFKEKPYSNGDPWVRITYDTPEVYSDLQRRFVEDQFVAINEYIGNGSEEVWSYLDLDDAVRYYMVKEIISDTESYHGSTYLFRDRGENQKWHFSPIWDCGNAFNGKTDKYFYECAPFGNTWIHTMVKGKKFADKLRETWMWFMSAKYPGLVEDIREYITHIAAAAGCDRERWKNAPLPLSGNATPVADNSDINKRYESVVAHIEQKINWLKGEWGDYSGGVYPEPERDKTLAAALPGYVGIEEVRYDNGGEAEYYTLQGIKVMNPICGEIYIIKEGNKARKVIYR